MILTVGSGSITVKNGKGQKLSIAKGKTGKATTSVYGSAAKSQQAVILELVESLASTTKQGRAAMDEAVQQFGYNELAEVENKLYQDRYDFSYNNSWIGNNVAKRFLEDYCGIRLENKDTGAITGSDAGGAVEKTSASIVPETGTAKTLTDAQYQSFTKNGLTVNVTYSESYNHNKYYSKSQFEKQEKLVVSNLYNWWIPSALNLIDQSLGINFTDGRASVNEIEVRLTNGSYYATSLSVETDMGLASKLTLTIDMDRYSEMTATDRNGANDSNSGIYLDQRLLSDLAEAALYANIPYFADLPSYVKDGLIGIVGGRDDQNASGIRDRAYYYSDFSSLNTDDGYIFLRYLAKQASGASMPQQVSISQNGQVVTIKNPFSGVFDASDYSENVKTINASTDKKKVTIYGTSKANIIRAGSGGSELYGRGGNDTLYGGAGRDVFFYGTGDGKETVMNFVSGKDFVRCYKGGVDRASASGNDVLLATGKGSVRVKGLAGKKLDVINAKGKTVSYYVGKGSDLLIGGAGSDVFQYATGDGKDTIRKYASGKDTIQITKGSVKSYTVKGKNVILAVGSGTITVEGAKGKKIALKDAGGKTGIYTFKSGTNRKLSTAAASSKMAASSSAAYAETESLMMPDVSGYLTGGSSSLEDLRLAGASRDLADPGAWAGDAAIAAGQLPATGQAAILAHTQKLS